MRYAAKPRNPDAVRTAGGTEQRRYAVLGLSGPLAFAARENCTVLLGVGDGFDRQYLHRRDGSKAHRLQPYPWHPGDVR